LPDDEAGDAAFTALLGRELATRDTLAPRLETIGEGPLRGEVLIERLMPPLALLAVGVNATSLALSRLALGLGWEVTLIEHRMNHPPEPGIDLGPVRCFHLNPADLRQQLMLDARTLAVVMTHDLQCDIGYLNALAAAALGYLGAIGSRSRARKLREACPAPGLRVPAGLDLGAETPEEIAVAIMAEMLAVAAGRGAAPLHATAGPMHY
jgi:xanthine/CO dehydrogenase XdhC/CoxF family maturation factor